MFGGCDAILHVIGLQDGQKKEVEAGHIVVQRRWRTGFTSASMRMNSPHRRR